MWSYSLCLRLRKDDFMRKSKSIVAIGMACSLLVTSGIPAQAAETQNKKEEVVYIMTNAAGDMDSAYVVNIMDGGTITDYGNYSSVKMLNTTDKISLDGDTVQFSSKADKVYYEGTLKQVEIPWNISITYYLDGTQYEPEELAGKSGALKIKFKITENTACKNNFFDDYALQAAFSLDTTKCKNIKAEDATIANVGDQKQLSYTILAGKGISTSITADVTDFEMDAVSINGVKLNFSIDVDSSELTDQVKELEDGIEKIANGSNEVSDGAKQLQTGGADAKTGTEDLTEGIKTLDDGTSNLTNGMKKMQTGLQTLNTKSNQLVSGSKEVKQALSKIQKALNGVSTDTKNIEKLVSASGSIQKAIKDLKQGAKELETAASYASYKSEMKKNGLDIDTLKSGNTAAINNLNTQIAQLNETLSQIKDVPGYEEQVKQLQEQVNSLSQTVTLLQGNNGAITGTEQYLNGVSSAAGQLYAGLEQLDSNYETFNKSINTLATTMKKMLVNMSALSEGINTLCTQYKTLDKGITAYTNGVGNLVQGYSQLMAGVSQLSSGSKQLLSGAKSLDSGMGNLYDGITSLADGAGKVSTGADKMRNKTTGMDTKIDEKIDDVTKSITGTDSEVVSFASEKNKNIKSVQFVIKTSAITMPEQKEEKQETEEKLNFGQKILHLFGIK